MRKHEIIDRATWELCLAEMSEQDIADALRSELASHVGGDACEAIEVSTDSLGHIDSMSSPKPATITL
jgi:hypothetical protein